MGRVTATRWFASLLCAALLATLAFVPSATAKDKKEGKKTEIAAAEALLDKAAKLTNIEAADGQSFTLLADTTWTEGGKTVSGQIGLAWQARERHREEVTFPGFLETTVVANNELRRLRSTAYVPLEEMHWLQMLQFWYQMNDWGKKKAKIDNSAPPKELAALSNISCVTAAYEIGRDTLHRRACFDTASGRLLLLQQRVDKEVVTQTFSSYGTLGNKEFPFEISYQDTAGARGEVRIAKLNAVGAFPASTFQLPAPATVHAWCATPTLKGLQEPDFAADNFLRWLPGRRPVHLTDPYVFVIVGVKGDVQNSFLFDSNPNLGEQSAFSTIRKETFPIELCGTQPISYEFFMRLGHDQPIP